MAVRGGEMIKGTKLGHYWAHFVSHLAHSRSHLGCLLVHFGSVQLKPACVPHPRLRRASFLNLARLPLQRGSHLLWQLWVHIGCHLNTLGTFWALSGHYENNLIIQHRITYKFKFRFLFCGPWATDVVRPKDLITKTCPLVHVHAMAPPLGSEYVMSYSSAHCMNTASSISSGSCRQFGSSTY